MELIFYLILIVSINVTTSVNAAKCFMISLIESDSLRFRIRVVPTSSSHLQHTINLCLLFSLRTNLSAVVVIWQ